MKSHCKGYVELQILNERHLPWFCNKPSHLVGLFKTGNTVTWACISNTYIEVDIYAAFPSLETIVRITHLGHKRNNIVVKSTWPVSKTFNIFTYLNRQRVMTSCWDRVTLNQWDEWVGNEEKQNLACSPTTFSFTHSSSWRTSQTTYFLFKGFKQQPPKYRLYEIPISSTMPATQREQSTSKRNLWIPFTRPAKIKLAGICRDGVLATTLGWKT